MKVLPKVKYRVKAMAIKIPMTYFAEVKNFNQKYFIFSNHQNDIEKKEQMWAFYQS
jgi:hypothetical protein